MPVIDVATDPQHLTLTVVADFAHPVERVWAAYTDPRQLERFWGPPAWPATFTAWDHTVGGRALYRMTGPRGETSCGAWEFLAIEPPRRFEVLDAFADEAGNPTEGMDAMRMEFRFEPTGEGTRMTTTTWFASNESLEQVLAMGMVEGLTLAMGQIGAVLEGLRAYAQGKGVQTELLSDTHVRLTRLVEGPRELVWRAHHDPGLLRRWLLGPDGWRMSACEVATEVGGAYRYAWEPVGDTEGAAFGFEGELLLSEEPRRAVTTERMSGTQGPQTLNDLELYEEDGATLVTTIVEYPDRATRDAILATGMAGGMEASYARLEALLAE